MFHFLEEKKNKKKFFHKSKKKAFSSIESKNENKYWIVGSSVKQNNFSFSDNNWTDNDILYVTPIESQSFGREMIYGEISLRQLT